MGTFTNYFWGGNEEELAQETVPRAQEVEDWIVVGEKPKDFQDSRESSKKQSQRNNSSSKQRLHSLMFGDESSSKSGSWNRSTISGEKNQMYKQNRLHADLEVARTAANLESGTGEQIAAAAFRAQQLLRELALRCDG